MRLSLARGRGEAGRAGGTRAAGKLARKGDPGEERAVSGSRKTPGNPAGTLAWKQVASFTGRTVSKHGKDPTNMDAVGAWP